MKEQFMLTPEEFKKAKESMSDEQRKMSIEREATIDYGANLKKEEKKKMDIESQFFDFLSEHDLSQDAVKILNSDVINNLKSGGTLNLHGGGFLDGSKKSSALIEILEKFPNITRLSFNGIVNNISIPKNRKVYNKLISKINESFPDIKIEH